MSDMTRGAFAVMLANHLGLDLSVRGGFSDTKNEKILDAATTALANAGITSGVGGGLFDAKRIITRAEAAVMFARAAKLSGATSGPFTDLGGTNGSMSALIQAAGNEGLFQGTSVGVFDPSAPFQLEHFGIVLNNSGNLFSSTPSDSSLPPPVTPGPPAPVVSTPPESTLPPDTAPVGEPQQDPFVPSDANSIQFIEGIISNYGIELTQEVRDFINEAFTQNWDTVRINQELMNPSTTWFHDAFPELLPRAENPNVDSLTASQVLELRSTFQQLMGQSAAPAGFYDGPEDFTNWIINDVSPVEISRRLQAADQLVISSDNSVREYFSQYYGGSSDSALFTYFLDQEIAPALLERQLRAAEIGGSGTKLGVDIGAERALELSGMGVTRQGAQSAFRRLDSIRGLFEETASEVSDFDIAAEGVDAEFGLTQGMSALLERRRATRVAALSGRSSVASTKEGIVGLG